MHFAAARARGASLDFHHGLGAEQTFVSLALSLVPGKSCFSAQNLQIAACMQTVCADERATHPHTCKLHAITILYSHCKRRTRLGLHFLHSHVNKMQNLLQCARCSYRNAKCICSLFASVFVSCISICARDSNANWFTSECEALLLLSTLQNEIAMDGNSSPWGIGICATAKLRASKRLLIYVLHSWLPISVLGFGSFRLLQFLK